MQKKTLLMDRGSMRALAIPPSSVAVDTICPAKILQLKKIEKVVTKWSPSISKNMDS